jgi:hypothetical protein
MSIVAGPSSQLFTGTFSWTYLGIVLLLSSRRDERRLAWRAALLRTGAAAGLFAAVLIALNVMLPQLSRSGASTIFPGRELAQGIQQAWTKAGQSGSIPVLGGPADLVQNINWYAGNSTPRQVYENLESPKTAAAADAALMKLGGMVLWHLRSNEEQTLAELERRLGPLNRLDPLSLNWQSRGNIPPLRIGLAIVQPETVQRNAGFQVDRLTR